MLETEANENDIFSAYPGSHLVLFETGLMCHANFSLSQAYTRSEMKSNCRSASLGVNHRCIESLH